MRFHNKRHKRKVKKYKKIFVCEYAVLFYDSDCLIKYIGNVKNTNVLSSSLYTKNGIYELVITSNTTKPKIEENNIIFKDKLHIDDIKATSTLICKEYAIVKLQKAFKVI